MIFHGVTFLARGLAIQYGDGLANNAFWQAHMYFYNLLGKVEISFTVYKTYFYEIWT